MVAVFNKIPQAEAWVGIVAVGPGVGKLDLHAKAPAMDWCVAENWSVRLEGLFLFLAGCMMSTLRAV